MVTREAEYTLRGLCPWRMDIEFPLDRHVLRVTATVPLSGLSC